MLNQANIKKINGNASSQNERQPITSIAKIFARYDMVKNIKYMVSGKYISMITSFFDNVWMDKRLVFVFARSNVESFYQVLLPLLLIRR